MFTGIVQGLCPVVRVEKQPNLTRLAVAIGPLAQGIETGASVAVNGVCLTVTGHTHGGEVSFDVIAETLKTTNLGDLDAGTLVNIERSFRVGDEVGGHILSGHVHDTVTLVEIREEENVRDLHFEVAGRWMKYLHHKGFVALDGASLTIADVNESQCRLRVSLIPETIARTTLGQLRVGDRVNLEVDAQTQSAVDTVERMLQSPEFIRRLSQRMGSA